MSKTCVLTKVIANVKIPDKQIGQWAAYKECVGAAALGDPLAAILQIAIVLNSARVNKTKTGRTVKLVPTLHMINSY